jgi:hypothetical protein
MKEGQQQRNPKAFRQRDQGGQEKKEIQAPPQVFPKGGQVAKNGKEWNHG